LRILDAEEKALASASFPPGSLRRTAKASTLKVEAE
jgi:hypothetical protein